MSDGCLALWIGVVIAILGGVLAVIWNGARRPPARNKRPSIGCLFGSHWDIQPDAAHWQENAEEMDHDDD